MTWTAAAKEENGQEVVTTEESIDTTEENSNVAINYSQPTNNVNQVVYHNDGSYIEYAYQVKIRPECSTLIGPDPSIYSALIG